MQIGSPQMSLNCKLYKLPLTPEQVFAFIQCSCASSHTNIEDARDIARPKRVHPFTVMPILFIVVEFLSDILQQLDIQHS